MKQVLLCSTLKVVDCYVGSDTITWNKINQTTNHSEVFWNLSCSIWSSISRLKENINGEWLPGDLRFQLMKIPVWTFKIWSLIRWSVTNPSARETKIHKGWLCLGDIENPSCCVMIYHMWNVSVPQPAFNRIKEETTEHNLRKERFFKHSIALETICEMIRRNVQLYC